MTKMKLLSVWLGINLVIVVPVLIWAIRGYVQEYASNVRQCEENAALRSRIGELHQVMGELRTDTQRERSGREQLLQNFTQTSQYTQTIIVQLVEQLQQAAQQAAYPLRDAWREQPIEDPPTVAQADRIAAKASAMARWSPERQARVVSDREVAPYPVPEMSEEVGDGDDDE